MAKNGSATNAARARGAAWLWIAIAVWIVALGVVWWVLAAYEFAWEPRDTGVVERWPHDARLAAAADRPNLLFFMHPKCPCTRASIAELEKLWMLSTADSTSAPRLTVIVTVPWGATDDWYESDTVKKVSTLRDVNLVIDRNGEEARRFGVSTSGTVMWFDTNGRRLYSGGITASRGHQGDSAGGDAVAALLRGHNRPAAGLPTFGCRLCLPDTATAAEPAAQQITTETKRDDAL